ncbi:MAG TPA: flagellar export chaperone FliS [Bacillota bacterium]|nr:flagellar export chaperone FliS [Bacillota bacterium]HPZ64329.1 flagellar export chaperone FliS [Bacillota bacterium]HQD05317.1 flagellar export chaperone FliS [Bacillota bacterium]
MTENPYQRYRANAVETADPGRLILLLYDGALRFINQAEQALEGQDYEQAHYKLLRAQDIIAELMGSLDLEQGELAVNLFRLYDYMHYRLIQANIKKSAAPLQEVSAMLKSLRESWQEVCRQRVAVGSP